MPPRDTDLSASFMQNRVLRNLPPEQLKRLLPALEKVQLELRVVLQRPGEPVPYVYFPQGAVVSFIVNLEDGGAVEVGTVGRQGMVGSGIALGSNVAVHEALVQIAGEALRISAEKITSAFEDDLSLRLNLLRVVQAFQVQVSLTAACNATHTVEERCARWLLIARDRVGADDYRLTQEFLSMMLAVRRAGVTMAAGALQKAGLIRYRHGHVTILDPAGLEDASCECFRRIKEAEDHLIG